MGKRIRNVIASLFLMTAVVFGVVQLNMPVASAVDCPPASSVGCGCIFTGETPILGGKICHYLCGGCNSGEEPVYIERDVEVYD
jgi:hypothetical protein